MNVTHIVDCGANSATLYTVETDTVEVLTHADVLNLPERLSSGSHIVGEYSHLGCPRTEFSLSQPYTEELLLDFYKRLQDNNIKLSLFPQKSTPRACSWSGLKKSDMTDPIAIYNLLRDFPEICMMKPPRSLQTSLKRAESYVLKKKINAAINRARREAPSYSTDLVSEIIRKNLDALYNYLSPLERDMFGFTRTTPKGKVCENRFTKNTDNGKKGEWKIDVQSGGVSMQALYAIFVCFIDPYWDVDDTHPIRMRTDFGANEMIPVSKSYCKRFLLCQSPFHLKGGVARSNLYHHGIRNWTKRRAILHGLNLKGKTRGGYFDDDRKNPNVKDNTRFSPEEDKFFREARSAYCAGIKKVQSFILDNIDAWLPARELSA